VPPRRPSSVAAKLPRNPAQAALQVFLRPRALGSFQFGEAFSDTAAGRAGLRRTVQPPLQHRDLFCLLAEFPVDDGGLLGVQGSGFAAVAVAFGGFDGFVAEDQGFCEPAFAFSCLIGSTKSR
jgi:hypothetical protein